MNGEMPCHTVSSQYVNELKWDVLAEIQKLVLSGRMGEAIETTQQLYPSLLESNPNLLFMLK